MTSLQHCGQEATETLIHFGSYFIRCAKCGETIIATSLIAFEDSALKMRAYPDPGFGKKPNLSSLIASGELKDYFATISTLVNQGQVILLQPI